MVDSASAAASSRSRSQKSVYGIWLKACKGGDDDKDALKKQRLEQHWMKEYHTTRQRAGVESDVGGASAAGTAPGGDFTTPSSPASSDPDGAPSPFQITVEGASEPSTAAPSKPTVSVNLPPPTAAAAGGESAPPQQQPPQGADFSLAHIPTVSEVMGDPHSSAELSPDMSRASSLYMDDPRYHRSISTVLPSRQQTAPQPAASRPPSAAASRSHLTVSIPGATQQQAAVEDFSFMHGVGVGAGAMGVMVGDAPPSDAGGAGAPKSRKSSVRQPATTSPRARAQRVVSVQLVPTASVDAASMATTSLPPGTLAGTPGVTASIISVEPSSARGAPSGPVVASGAPPAAGGTTVTVIPATPPDTARLPPQRLAGAAGGTPNRTCVVERIPADDVLPPQMPGAIPVVNVGGAGIEPANPNMLAVPGPAPVPRVADRAPWSANTSQYSTAGHSDFFGVMIEGVPRTATMLVDDALTAVTATSVPAPVVSSPAPTSPFDPYRAQELARSEAALNATLHQTLTLADAASESVNAILARLGTATAAPAHPPPPLPPLADPVTARPVAVPDAVLQKDASPEPETRPVTATPVPVPDSVLSKDVSGGGGEQPLKLLDAEDDDNNNNSNNNISSDNAGGDRSATPVRGSRSPSREEWCPLVRAPSATPPRAVEQDGGYLEVSPKYTVADIVRQPSASASAVVPDADVEAHLADLRAAVARCGSSSPAPPGVDPDPPQLPADATPLPIPRSAQTSPQCNPDEEAAPAVAAGGIESPVLGPAQHTPLPARPDVAAAGDSLSPQTPGWVREYLTRIGATHLPIGTLPELPVTPREGGGAVHGDAAVDTTRICTAVVSPVSDGGAPSWVTTYIDRIGAQHLPEDLLRTLVGEGLAPPMPATVPATLAGGPDPLASLVDASGLNPRPPLAAEDVAAMRCASLSPPRALGVRPAGVDAAAAIGIPPETAAAYCDPAVPLTTTYDATFSGLLENILLPEVAPVGDRFEPVPAAAAAGAPSLTSVDLATATLSETAPAVPAALDELVPPSDAPPASYGHGGEMAMHGSPPRSASPNSPAPQPLLSPPQRSVRGVPAVGEPPAPAPQARDISPPTVQDSTAAFAELDVPAVPVPLAVRVPYDPPPLTAYAAAPPAVIPTVPAKTVSMPPLPSPSPSPPPRVEAEGDAMVPATEPPGAGFVDMLPPATTHGTAAVGGGMHHRAYSPPPQGHGPGLPDPVLGDDPADASAASALTHLTASATAPPPSLEELTTAPAAPLSAGGGGSVVQSEVAAAAATPSVPHRMDSTKNGVEAAPARSAHHAQGGSSAVADAEDPQPTTPPARPAVPTSAAAGDAALECLSPPPHSPTTMAAMAMPYQVRQVEGGTTREMSPPPPPAALAQNKSETPPVAGPLPLVVPDEREARAPEVVVEAESSPEPEPAPRGRVPTPTSAAAGAPAPPVVPGHASMGAQGARTPGAVAPLPIGSTGALLTKAVGTPLVVGASVSVSASAPVGTTALRGAEAASASTTVSGGVHVNIPLRSWPHATPSVTPAAGVSTPTTATTTPPAGTYRAGGTPGAAQPRGGTGEYHHHNHHQSVMSVRDGSRFPTPGGAAGAAQRGAVQGGGGGAAARASATPGAGTRWAGAGASASTPRSGSAPAARRGAAAPHTPAAPAAGVGGLTHPRSNTPGRGSVPRAGTVAATAHPHPRRSPAVPQQLRGLQATAAAVAPVGSKLQLPPGSGASAKQAAAPPAGTAAAPASALSPAAFSRLHNLRKPGVPRLSKQAKQAAAAAAVADAETDSGAPTPVPSARPLAVPLYADAASSGRRTPQAARRTLHSSDSSASKKRAAKITAMEAPIETVYATY